MTRTTCLPPPSASLLSLLPWAFPSFLVSDPRLPEAQTLPSSLHPCLRPFIKSPGFRSHPPADNCALPSGPDLSPESQTLGHLPRESHRPLGLKAVDTQLPSLPKPSLGLKP